MTEFKELYADTWKKAADQTKRLMGMIQRNYSNLRLINGKGATVDNYISKETGGSAGAPDIFVYNGPFLVCTIEVTGSDRVIPEKDVWLAAHKLEYAKKVGDLDMCGYFFFFGERGEVRYFITAERALELSPIPQTRKPKGTIEHYHILSVASMQNEKDFWRWLDRRAKWST